MLVKALVTAAAAASLVTAQELMRFGCAQLTVDRVDPLVEPGNKPSAHMHQIIGGNSFNASMQPSDVDPPTDSTCTSCTYSEDFSNYWTASVYFKARNGTFKRVPQTTNLGLGTKAGMTIYYIRGYQQSAKVTAFPKVKREFTYPLPLKERLRWRYPVFCQYEPKGLSQYQNLYREKD